MKLPNSVYFSEEVIFVDKFNKISGHCWREPKETKSPTWLITTASGESEFKSLKKAIIDLVDSLSLCLRLHKLFPQDYDYPKWENNKGDKSWLLNEANKICDKETINFLEKFI